MLRTRGKFLLVGVALVVIVAAIVGIFVKIGSLETTKKVTTFDYAIGQLDSDGKTLIEDDKSGIYMKDYISTDGLSIELEEDADIEFSVNYYTEKYAFISATAFGTTFNEETIPETAKWVRIEIKPTADKDGKVTFTEVSKYAKMLKVVYNK